MFHGNNPGSVWLLKARALELVLSGINSLFQYVVGMLQWVWVVPCPLPYHQKKKKKIRLEPRNVILLGLRVFAEIIKVKLSGWDHPGLGWALYAVIDVLIRDRKKEDRHTER